MPNSIANVTASQTDSPLVAAVSGRSIRVKAFILLTGGMATAVTFNTKGSGAGTAISPQLQLGANGGAVVPTNGSGWFETNQSEALTVTTGPGSTTGILVLYELLP